jgi:IclR family mhp operon transcriptional activator
MDRENLIQSVARALEVVEVLNQRRVTSLDVLHETTGLPKPTLARILETLMDCGYVFRVSRREGYALTERVLRLSAGMRHRDVLVDIARPHMEAFTRQWKWQVSLATSEIDCMLVRWSTRDISPFSREQNFLNRRIPMLLSAMGRAYIAYCSTEEREFILEFLRVAGDRNASGEGPARLQVVIERTLRNGYATVGRPRSNPTRSFAIPIMDTDAPDTPLGAVAMFYYRSAMTESKAVQRYLPPLRDLAQQIVSDLALACMDAESSGP